MAQSPFLAELSRVGVVAVIRGTSADQAVEMGQALVAGGMLGIEVTFTTPDCARAIRQLRDFAPASVAVGAGTVRSIADLEAAASAGAGFAVSPHFDVAICTAAKRLGIPYLPGCITPTEILTAWNAGASCIKLFPGSLVGVDYVNAIRGPLPDVPFMPTGGVTLANMPEWFAAGVVAVGMGGGLAKGTPAQITAAAQAAMARLGEIRVSRPG